MKTIIVTNEKGQLISAKGTCTAKEAQTNKLTNREGSEQRWNTTKNTKH